jgi:hypothetical protein
MPHETPHSCCTPDSRISAWWARRCMSRLTAAQFAIFAELGLAFKNELTDSCKASQCFRRRASANQRAGPPKVLDEQNPMCPRILPRFLHRRPRGHLAAGRKNIEIPRAGHEIFELLQGGEQAAELLSNRATRTRRRTQPKRARCAYRPDDRAAPNGASSAQTLDAERLEHVALVHRIDIAGSHFV